MKNSQRLLAAVSVLAFVAAGSACSSNEKKDEPKRPDLTEREMRLAAGELYRLARESLDSSDFEEAIRRYDAISLRFPFTEYATQSELEKVYALYRGFDSDKAISAADRFLREHPRHPAADYVQYLKGLTNYSRDKSFSDIIGASDTKGDVTNDRRAFDDFSLLVQKYPQSRYAGDARARMIYLRNRIAEHELHVVRFYIKRGAYLAAAKRAEQVISQYPGAPASYEALELLETCYTRAGLATQAEDVRRVRMAQPALPAQQQAAADATQGGFMGWFNGLFREREIVIPTGGDAPPPAAAAAGEPAAPAASGEKGAIEGQLGGSRLRLTMEPYDDGAPAPAPAAEPAAPPASEEPAKSTAPGDPNATGPAPATP